MGTKIKDEDFDTPAEINATECFTASRWLNKVEESVKILQVCQDSTNSALVIIDFSLAGAFQFTPFCNILSVDGDTSYLSNGTQAPLAVGHFQNPDIPILTNCQTISSKIVFDFGAVIPDFISAQVVEFELGMVGEVPQAFGVSFPNQTPTDTFLWQKGVLPTPINLTYQNGNLNVVFDYAGQAECACNVQCVSPTGVTHQITFCADQRQAIDIDVGLLTGDPASILLTLQDSVGNNSDMLIQAMTEVIPTKPSVVISSERIATIAITNTSLNGQELIDAQYQILRYQGSESNFSIWKDWSKYEWSSFIDDQLLPGTVYGYAVRYKGSFNDFSNLSSWTTVAT